MIKSTLEKMENLIANILEYSSIASSENITVEINTQHIVDELLEMLFIPDHITVKVLGELPVLKGDQTKIHQVFQNLITNAIKYNDKEEGLITIDVKEQLTYFEFSIKDNGIGIEKKNHDKIFKIFNALHRDKDSTGVGLSIVKKIIDLHGGDIWLESEPGEGSVFYFTLKK